MGIPCCRATIEASLSSSTPISSSASQGELPPLPMSQLTSRLSHLICSNFYSGGTWGRTRQLSLPSLPLVSAFSPSSATEFATSADHLANANSLGIALLPAPPHIRKRAALERGLNTFFHQGHRGSAYVLCVETRWTDPRWTDEEMKERLSLDGEEKETPREEQCGPLGSVGDVGYAEAAMETVSWEGEPVLKEFEAAFYKAGGKANGHGFR